MPGQRAPLFQRPPDHLVDRVVSPHILAHDEGLPPRREQSGRVQSPSLVEDVLGPAQAPGQGVEHARRNLHRVLERWGVRHHVLDRRLPADPTATRGVDIAAQASQVDLHPRREHHLHHVVLRLGGLDRGAVPNGGDLLGVLDHALGDQKAPGQLLVVPGGAHDDRERYAAQPDLQRFFTDDAVGVSGSRLALDLGTRDLDEPCLAVVCLGVHGGSIAQARYPLRPARGMLGEVTRALAATLRSAFETARGGDLAGALAQVPTPWREVLERIATGPDPDAALLRASNLPDACLLAPFPAALINLLHQGSYPARLLTLDPDAIEVLGEPRPGAPGRAALIERIGALAEELGLEEAIARVRNREYLRLARREVEQAPLEETGAALSDLVGACTDVALDRLEPGLSERVAVFGMGKLGGDELNFISDIDLIFCHADDAIPQGEREHAHKTRLFGHLRKLVALLEGSGRWRPLFRVDLRLRPFGSRGPLSLSLSGMEAYYERHGRDWERQVWLRGRPLAGNLELGEQLVARLEPFVYRRSVSPRIFEEVAELMRRARRQSQSSLGSGGVDLKHDAGGIREVEFFVQGLQLLNGGKNPGVRARGTLRALDRLVAAGLLSDREHEQLGGAYRWLRRVEHRIQLAEGQQTHRVPAAAEAAATLAARLAPQVPPEAAVAEFRASLRGHRDAVMSIAQTLRDPEETELLESERVRLWARDVVTDPGAPQPAQVDALQKLGVRDPEEVCALLQHLRTRRQGAFASAGRAAEGADRLLLACLDSADPDTAVRRLAEFGSARPAHFAVWRFLADPAQIETVRLVAELLGSSEPLSRGLIGFSHQRRDSGDDSVGLMLEANAARLADPTELQAARNAFAQLRSPPETADELDGDLLQFKHHELVRIGLFDLGRGPDPFTVGQALSDLADLVVGELLADSARRYEDGEIGKGPRHAFDLAVFALGKYGMQAMDYGSDLDLMFVFRPHDEEASEVREHAIMLGRRLIARLENRSRGARLYEVDMRLRPSGRQGLLVSSLEGFVSYHAQSLPVWERLALLRTRCVATIGVGGDDPQGPARLERGVMDQIQATVAGAPAQTPAQTLPEVATAVRTLKQRIEAEVARETRGLYDPKSGYGGSLEAELLVGALQLLHTAESGTRAIPPAIAELCDAGVMDAESGAALLAAYRFVRRLLNRLRMMHSGLGGTAPDRVTANSPRSNALARRMGLADADALIDTYLDKREIIRQAFDRHLPSK